MSTVENSGLAESEHKPEPTAAVGGKAEVDRSVSWTDQRSGFAELRARLKQQIDGAIDAYWSAQGNRDYRRMDQLVDEIVLARERLRTIDDLEADAKDAST